MTSRRDQWLVDPTRRPRRQSDGCPCDAFCIGHREFVADLASHCAGLGEPQMVGVSGASAADQTRLRSDKFEMAFIAIPARLADRELAFLDFGGSGVDLKMCRSRLTIMDGWLRRERRRSRLLGRGFDLSGPPLLPHWFDGIC